MKKIMSAMAIVSAMGLAACDNTPKAKNGDTVLIDFTGYLDGVPFQGGAGNNYPLTLGSGMFVPGFEEQLVGARRGETRDINITFPENYVPELAGKSVVFKVTVNDVLKDIKITITE